MASDLTQFQNSKFLSDIRLHQEGRDEEEDLL